MEFADLIKISRCERVMLSQSFHPRINGALCITSHHFIVSSSENQEQELWILHSNIDHVEKKQLGMTGGSLKIKCKDLRVLELDIIGASEFSNVAETLENLTKVLDPSLQYPFFYQPSFQILEDGWTAFLPDAEFLKLVQCGEEWRISTINTNYKVCSSYSKSVVVPKGIEDSELMNIACFRQAGRFPVLAYCHEGEAALLRSGQLNCPPNMRRCKDDEKLLSLVLVKDRKGYIIDTRTQNLAQSAKVIWNGAAHLAQSAKVQIKNSTGQEGELYYPNWRRIHKAIDRHHTLCDSLSKLMDAANELSSGTDKWLNRLENSGWMNQIKETLNCACLVAQCLDQEKASVLVHDTDGMDATLQVTSLAQIILNPDCRTVRGFEALIEREWVQGGHPFATRHTYSAYTPSAQRSRSNAPTFLLFLDCVYQIYAQFMCSFEFSEAFLIMLFEHSYSSQFGTFLCNNDSEKESLGVMQKTTSLWSYINRPEVLSTYLNPMYEPNTKVIWPSVAPMSLQLWDGVFLRWVINQRPQDDAWKVVKQLKERDVMLRSKVVRLRHQLQELEKEAVSASLITPEEIILVETP